MFSSVDLAIVKKSHNGDASDDVAERREQEPVEVHAGGEISGHNGREDFTTSGDAVGEPADATMKVSNQTTAIWPIVK